MYQCNSGLGIKIGIPKYTTRLLFYQTITYVLSFDYKTCTNLFAITGGAPTTRIFGPAKNRSVYMNLLSEYSTKFL